MQAWFVTTNIIALCAIGCGQGRAKPARTEPATHARFIEDDAGARAADRSRGCGKAPGPPGERRIQVEGRTGAFIVSIPGRYDSTRAYPLGFAFHGRNRNHVDCQQTDCAGVQSVMGEQALLVYMQSLREPLDQQQGGWEWPSEREDNVRFFQTVLSTMRDEYCVDPKRVFVAGGSSGGAFANLLGCRYADQLQAVAAVSGGWLEDEACTGVPAALLLHGIDDPHVPIARGELARESYRARQKCSATSTPPITDMHAAVRAARDAAPGVETAQCVDYQGCSPGSGLRWCEHSFGGYDGTTHGWPPVGGQLIWDFVSRL